MRQVLIGLLWVERSTLLFLLSIYKRASGRFGRRKSGKGFFAAQTVHVAIRMHQTVTNPLVSRLVSKPVNVQGHEMFVDRKDSLWLLTNPLYEPYDTALVRQEVKEGDVVLDVGANLGYYTLIFAKLVGPKGKVFAFEPDPENFSLLKRNIKLNGYKNVVAIRRIVSDKTGNAKLFISKYNNGDNRIFDSQDASGSITVESTTLDDYFRNYKGRINFVKMDTQGADGKILFGMKKLLKKNKRIKVLVEFWPYGLKNLGTDPKKFLQFLQSQGFRLFNVNDKPNAIKRANVETLADLYAPETKDYTNLYCLRD